MVRLVPDIKPVSNYGATLVYLDLGQIKRNFYTYTVKLGYNEQLWTCQIRSL